MSRRKKQKRSRRAVDAKQPVAAPLNSSTADDEKTDNAPADWLSGEWLWRPVPTDSVALCRIAFGLAMLWTGVHWWYTGHYAVDFIEPPFHFTYFGFAWVKPLPPVGMWAVLAVFSAASVGVTIGLFYRVSVAVCLVAFTYLFLLEKSLYLNHHYLMCLLALVFLITPAHRAWSVDSLWRRGLQSDVAPGWALWLLRFQIALPYVYGGLVKCNPDWLRGQPMHTWLGENGLRFLLGPVTESYWFALVFSYGGLLFDLSIVPLLLWKRTRVFAFCWAVAFHLLNAIGFDIGVFPWLMLVATTIFLPPDWVRRLVPDLTPRPSTDPEQGSAHQAPSRWGALPKVMTLLVALFIGGQMVVPWRHFLYPGRVDWTEEGQLFAWRMMLRSKRTGVQFVYYDPATGRQIPAPFARWLTRNQLEKVGTDPDMLREFAHFLRQHDDAYQAGYEVRAVALCSFNGRQPQLLVDHTVDLSRQPRRWTSQPWIKPMQTPFRYKPFDAPPSEWLKYVDLSQKK